MPQHYFSNQVFLYDGFSISFCIYFKCLISYHISIAACFFVVLHLDSLFVFATNLHMYFYRAAYVPNVYQPDAANIGLEEKRCLFSAEGLQKCNRLLHPG